MSKRGKEDSRNRREVQDVEELISKEAPFVARNAVRLKIMLLALRDVHGPGAAREGGGG
jgi:hypothetical protein